jgi:hypothetical protein
MGAKRKHPCYNARVSTAQEEALGIFAAVVDDLTTGGVELNSTLRRCIHAARLLGWQDNVSWLNAELNGFAADQALPPYRRSVPAYTQWVAHTLDAIAKLVVTEQHGDKPTKTWTHRDLRVGVAQLKTGAEKGLVWRTGNEDTRHLKTWDQDVPVHEVLVMPKESVAQVVEGLENALFSYASEAYSVLRLGDSVGDIWRDFRNRVDEALARIGLQAHLEAIRTGLESDNPEQWRQAMWACRDLLRDLAAHLWQNSHKTYPYLKNDKGAPIAITSDKYVNRLMAYLHQKGVTGTAGAYLRAELERINSSIQTLNKLYNEAHEPVTLDDARLAAVTVYTLLGEFVARTDMQPVLEYE